MLYMTSNRVSVCFSSRRIHDATDKPGGGLARRYGSPYPDLRSALNEQYRLL